MFDLMYEYKFARTRLSHEVSENDENPLELRVKEWVQT